MVPHPLYVSQEKLAKAAQVPVDQIKMRKLKDISDETGFPVFVCPPFGHPKDKLGRDPLILIDSSVTDSKRPLLFDCGKVGLSMATSELVRSTGAACIDGLGYLPKAAVEASKPVNQVHAVDASEPAPEP